MGFLPAGCWGWFIGLGSVLGYFEGKDKARFYEQDDEFQEFVSLLFILLLFFWPFLIIIWLYKFRPIVIQGCFIVEEGLFYGHELCVE